MGLYYYKFLTRVIQSVSLMYEDISCFPFMAHLHSQDPDANFNLIPIPDSWVLESESESVQYEKFCSVQCSHVVCNRDEIPDLAM